MFAEGWAGRRLLAAGRDEVRRIGVAVAGRWRRHKAAGFKVTLLLTVAVLAIHGVDNGAGRHLVFSCCGESAGSPIGLALPRMPGSLIAPAAMLPVWGSIAQIVVTFGVAEATVGALRAIGVAGVGHLLSTLAARVLIWLGPGVFGGLAARYRDVLDTGPSAATVALGAYLVVVLRCPVLGVLAGAGLAAELVIRPDLAGREHVVAVLVGLVCGGAHLWILRRRSRQVTAEIEADVAVPSQ